MRNVGVCACMDSSVCYNMGCSICSSILKSSAHINCSVRALQDQWVHACVLCVRACVRLCMSVYCLMPFCDCLWICARRDDMHVEPWPWPPCQQYQTVTKHQVRSLRQRDVSLSLGLLLGQGIAAAAPDHSLRCREYVVQPANHLQT